MMNFVISEAKKDGQHGFFSGPLQSSCQFRNEVIL